MSTVSYAMQDSATMLQRNLRRTLRYPAAAAATVDIPIVFLLLFVTSSATRWAPAWRACPAGATSTSTTSPPGSS